MATTTTVRLPTAENSGYCYLAWFSHFPQKYLRKIAVELGAFPLIRDVLLRILQTSTHDSYVYSVRLTSDGYLHVDTTSFTPLSNLVITFIFTGMRVGADEGSEVASTAVDAVPDDFSFDRRVTDALCEVFTSRFDMAEIIRYSETDTTVIRRQIARRVLSTVAQNNPEKLLVPELMPSAFLKHNTVKYCPGLSPYEVALLKSNYPGLRFVEGKATTLNSHELNAVSRRAETLRILLMYNLFDPAVETDPFFLSDIGGNVVYVVKSMVNSVHVCSTTLDLRDGARRTGEQLAFTVEGRSGTCNDIKRRIPLYSPHSETSYRCMKGAQRCNVSSFVAMEIHVYDISMEDRARYLDRKNIKRLHQIVHFNPVMFHATSGILQPSGVAYERVDFGGEEYIRFTFRGACTNSYSHKWKDYIAPFVTKAIVTPNGRIYEIEIQSPRINQYEIVYTLVAGEFLYTQTHRMFNYLHANTEGYTAVPVVQKNVNEFLGRDDPSQITTTYVFFKNEFLNMAKRAGLSAIGKTNRAKLIMDVLSTYNSKKTINGVEYKSNYTYSVPELMSIAVYVDAFVYMEWYSMMKGLDWITDKAVTQLDQKEPLLHQIILHGSAIFDKLTHLYKNVMVFYRDFMQDLALKMADASLGVALERIRTDIVISVSDNFTTKYRMAIPDIGPYVPLPNIVYNQLADLIARRVVRVDVNAVRSDLASGNVHRSFRQSAVSYIHRMHKGNEKMASTLIKELSLYTRDVPQLPADSRFQPILGDGSCLYASLLVSSGVEFRLLGDCADPIFSVDSLRSLMYFVVANGRLTQNPLQLNRSDLDAAVQIFGALDDGHDDLLALRRPIDARRPETWACPSHMYLYSMLFRVRICNYVNVQVNGKLVSVNTPQYQPSQSSNSSGGDIFIHMPIPTGRGLSSCVTHADAWLTGVDHHDLIVHTYYAAVRSVRANDEYASPHRQILKFYSLLESLPVIGGDVLELGAAPGAWTRELVRLMDENFVGSITAVSPIAGEYLRFDPDVLALDGIDGVTIVDGYADEFLDGDVREYDYIISDVASADSWRDIGEQMDLLLPAARRLREGGNLVLKISNAFSSSLVDSVEPILPMFSRVIIVKPLGSRLRSTEAYIVATGYGRGSSTTAVFSASRNEVLSAMQGFCNDLLLGRPIDIVDTDARLQALLLRYRRAMRIGGHEISENDYVGLALASVAGTARALRILPAEKHKQFRRLLSRFNDAPSEYKERRLNVLEKWYHDVTAHLAYSDHEEEDNKFGFRHDVEVRQVLNLKTTGAPLCSKPISKYCFPSTGGVIPPLVPELKPEVTDPTPYETFMLFPDDRDDPDGDDAEGYTSDADPDLPPGPSADPPSASEQQQQPPAPSSSNQLLPAPGPAPSTSEDGQTKLVPSAKGKEKLNSKPNLSLKPPKTPVLPIPTPPAPVNRMALSSTLYPLEKLIRDMKRFAASSKRARSIAFDDLTNDIKERSKLNLGVGQRHDIHCYSLIVVFTMKSDTIETRLGEYLLRRGILRMGKLTLETGQRLLFIKQNGVQTPVIVVNRSVEGWEDAMIHVFRVISSSATIGYRYKVLFDVLYTIQLPILYSSICMGRTGLEYMFITTRTPTDLLKTYLAQYNSEVVSLPALTGNKVFSKIENDKIFTGPLVQAPTVPLTLSQTALYAGQEYFQIVSRLRGALVPLLTKVRAAFRDGVDIDMYLHKGYNAYDLKTQTTVYPDPWSRKRTDYFYVFNGQFVKYDQETGKFPFENVTETNRLAVYSRDTELLMDEKVLTQLKAVDLDESKLPAFYWLNGPPGCGKTTILVKNFDHANDIILSATRAGVAEIRARILAALKLKLPKVKVAELQHVVRTQVRTISSMLINGTAFSATRCFVDEATMVHAGMLVYAVAMMPSAKQVFMVGDVNQIAFVDRYHIGEMQFFQPSCISSPLPALRTTYRCPMDVVYAVSDRYPGLFTESLVQTSMTIERLTEIPNRKDTLYLAFTHTDKQHIMKAVAKGSEVMTVAESQGLTRKNVIIVRNTVNPNPIFVNTQQLTTAISRHTHSLLYLTKVTDDTLCGWMQKSIAKKNEDQFFVRFNQDQKANGSTADMRVLEHLNIHIGGVVSPDAVPSKTFVEAITTFAVGFFRRPPAAPTSPTRVYKSQLIILPPPCSAGSSNLAQGAG